MKVSIENDIRIAEVPVQDFKILLYDGRKKSMGKNRCTGGFFGSGKTFTTPAGHLVCDVESPREWTEFYCRERGTILDGRFWFDSGKWEYMNEFYGKKLSTLVIANGKANVQEIAHAPTLCSYAITGVPVMRQGAAVALPALHAQGWGGSSLRATYHILVGLKEQDASTVYAIALRTRTANMVKTGEAAKKLKPLGFRDVIKLDGGGSFYFNAAGNTLATGENRIIHSVLDFGQADGNPFAVPTKTVRRWSGDQTGTYWLQWELAAHGFPCELDGDFGPKTEKQLRAYQAANGLEVDGSCGPATRASLLKK